MMIIKNRWVFLSMGWIMVGLLGLTSCELTVREGTFVGPVSNLYYETETLSGYTDEDGVFEYKLMETVKFYVGDIYLGETKGKYQVTLFDLVGIDIPETNGEFIHIKNCLKANRDTGDPLKFVPKGGLPIERVINTAVFLESMDADEQYGNGIQIPGVIHTLSQDTGMELQMEYDTFYKCFPLRKLVAQGRSSGLWGGNRIIINPSYAMDHLYKLMGLTPSIWAIETRTGVTSTGYVSIGTKYYDDHGNEVTSEGDGNGDGECEGRRSMTYDENGNEILSYSESCQTGTISALSMRAHTYDENGCLTLYESDFSDDGSPGSVIYYTYDDFYNNILRESDSGNNGSIDSRTTQEFDSSGRLIREEKYDSRYGTITTLYTYDNDGNLILWQNGLTKYAYSYDEQGNRILTERDLDGDEIIEYREMYSYNEAEYLTLREIDSDGDGYINSRYSYSYGEDLSQTALYEELSDDADGTVETSSLKTYNPDGNVTLYAYDSDGDGDRDSEERMEYNDNGSLISYTGGGVLDVTNTYDYRGNLINELHVNTQAQTTYTYTAVNAWAPVLNSY